MTKILTILLIYGFVFKQLMVTLFGHRNVTHLYKLSG